MKAFWTVLITAAVLVFSCRPAYSQGWYFDLALEFVDVGEDLSAVDPGLGLALEGGFEFAPGVAVNFGIASSAHSDDGRDLTYTRFWIGPRITFQAGGVKPYIEAGIMTHLMEYDYYIYDYPYYYDYEIDGTGLYLGGGLLFPLPMGGAAGVYANFADWEGEGNTGYVEDQGDVSTMVIGMNFIWGF